VVFDRLLARLLIVAPDRWILKGGVALDYRLGDRARTTRDLDLARQDSESEATTDLLAVQKLELDDFFNFVIRKTTTFDTAMEGSAIRFQVLAELDGRKFESVVIDIGFGDPLPDAPDRLQGPNLLGFAEIQPAKIPALPLEQHLAEKVHAYTRTYEGNLHSSRVKDLVDMILIQSVAAFEAGRLLAVIEKTFTSRITHPLPTALPAPPMTWRTPYRRLAEEVGVTPELTTGHKQVAALLDPLLGGEVPLGAKWDPLYRRWRT
jgi:hypothetical protein